ncbi:MAG TPA: MBL fold metallo-hydrolase, partial [Micromonosporaceae bacterium]
MSAAADLHHVAGGCHAWLQPDGGWGLSNAGVITGNGASVLVDTLFDLPLTRRMLDAMNDLVAAAPVRTLVNTHGNGDHWFGNELVRDAEIVAAASSVADMRAVGPQLVGALVSAPGTTGDYVRRIFGSYDF